MTSTNAPFSWPVFRALSCQRWFSWKPLSCATVPAGTLREESPSANAPKVVAVCGRSLGWRSMSAKSSSGGRVDLPPRKPATTTTPMTARKSAPSVSLKRLPKNESLKRRIFSSMA